MRASGFVKAQAQTPWRGVEPVSSWVAPSETAINHACVRTELDRPGQMVEWADGQSDRRMYLEQGGDFPVLFLLRKVERGLAAL